MPQSASLNDVSGIRPLEHAIGTGSPREAFLTLLDAVLAEERSGPAAVFAHENNPECLSIAEGQGGPRGTSLALVDAFRFIFVLGGTYRAIRDVRDRRQDRVVRSGEFYWIRPDDWNLVRNDSARTVLSVIFARNETRYVWYHHRREGEPERRERGARPEAHTALRYHTHAGASQELLHAVALMDAAMEKSAVSCGAVTARASARALLGWCLRELRLDANLEAAANAAGTLAPGRRAFDEICAYVAEHLQSDLSREQVAGVFRISEDHLTRLFRIHARCGFVEFVRAERFRLAERLLATSRLSVKEVAAACGFNLSEYFIKRFREQHGVTPAAWRRRHADARRAETGSSGA
ncbi:AraC family transcriptional regulator [Opitutaceae bacterium TAV5]|nr:AraC family transcriptional regulator [Opitutaceae bacterium TAV5]